MTLVIAGLLLRTVERDPGWRLIRQLRNVSFVDVGLPGGYSAERRAQVHEAVFERLRSLAGARNVAAASGSPASGAPGLVYVTPEYFETLRLPMVSGRGLDESDQPGEAAVVNESLAHLDWPNDNPLGKSLASGLWTFSSGTWRSADCARCTVVGVVKDREVAGEAPDQSWRIYQIALPLEMNAFIVRGGPRIAGSIAPVLVSIDPGVRVEVLRGTDWAIRHRPVRILCARLALALGSLALAFGAVGLFSISAYAVTQRTHEIGVRRALGAGGAVILGVVFGPVARALLRGCVIGGLGSVAAAQVMRVVGWLEGIGPLDPPTYVGVLLVLLVVTPVAAYMPARRAMRIEPMDALRHE
jgi:putative ABC transport system permease protein